ncbi:MULTISPECIES: TetR/AcrR family transcriptional regulator [Vibrio]|uniref:TetR/AcrR family transcriptional regulator n=1 Tax=Vibrio TaxID=662 RepID=UPI000B5C6115|nr:MULTISPECIES: TetR/AcrR family transcriptional regulator [Vibrio]AVF73920.1 TetR family transcriptional regulator [Vibrio alginolyticus]AVF75080.1 TetR family transcriptional regulator [Vibrio alginolyticus]
MRQKYQNENGISKSRASVPHETQLTGAKARTWNLLLSTALRMLEDGWFPSITELANAAGVGRATAYRYFPTQSALVSAVVDESLGPILAWQPKEQTATKRVVELLEFAYPQMLQHEGALRATLQVSLQQWAAERANKLEDNELLIRGHRKKLLALATAPLANSLSEKDFQRLQYALSLVYGSEIFMVLKDIWHLELDGIQDVTQWMAKALINQAEADFKNKND